MPIMTTRKASISGLYRFFNFGEVTLQAIVLEWGDLAEEQAFTSESIQALLTISWDD